MKSVVSKKLPEYKFLDRFELLTKAITVKPTEADAMFELASELYAMKLYPVAVSLLLDASRLAPPNNLASLESVYLRYTRHLYDRDIQSLLGLAAWQAKDYDLCLRSLSSLSALTPEESNAMRQCRAHQSEVTKLFPVWLVDSLTPEPQKCPEISTESTSPESVTEPTSLTPAPSCPVCPTCAACPTCPTLQQQQQQEQKTQHPAAVTPSDDTHLRPVIVSRSQSLEISVPQLLITLMLTVLVTSCATVVYLRRQSQVAGKVRAA